MVVESVERHKEKILAKLREAGPDGLTKSKLGAKDLKSKAGQALNALLKDRQVANLGTEKKSCYVQIEHFTPLERACKQIEKNAVSMKQARESTIELLIRKDLDKGCKGEIRKKVDEAIDWLVKEKRLIKLRRARTFYYLHMDKIRELLLKQKVEPLDHETVLAAYNRVKQRLGYSNVEISELKKELGVPMNQVKAFLLEESRRGNAVLTLGDWSVSSEEIRSGAIELYGKPHLLVRFDA